MSDDSSEQDPGTPQYEQPSGGWGSLKGILRILNVERPEPGVVETLLRQNQPGGHMCTSCAWTKPATPNRIEFCENGAKATIWDLTTDRCDPEFFARHSVSELHDWSDHDLERAGRLTHPMRYDAASDHYVPCTWEDAFAGIASELNTLEPASVVFYTSGRAGLEVSYLWALFARLYGHNNLPDSSNMCHETTSVTLPKVIGTPVGTCVLSDFDQCDMILFFGQNTGTNSPRFLHPLQAARARGCSIVSFNPVRERGLIEFASPQSPAQMLGGSATSMSDDYLQVRPGGDTAVLAGLCKAVLDRADGDPTVLDIAFITEHTNGFDAFRASMQGVQWADIETVSGLRREQIDRVADRYCQAGRSIGVYGMGLTQHVHGSQSIAMLVNLLLLRGNIGVPGAGISPVRGHSNVQGQRTVGIAEKPELVPLDVLSEQFQFEPPRTRGRNTVETVKGVLDGSVKGFIGLGGNFARAIPDQGRVDPAWSTLSLNVQIATRLNRSHLLVGRKSWLLPTLVRAEEDRQQSGPQVVTMEDSLSHVHGSIGRRTPASAELLSELAIVAGLAKATLPGNNATLRWDEWTADYARVRDLIATTYPDEFHDFDARKFTPGGFYRGNAARERHWNTASGKAEFTVPSVLSALGRSPAHDEYTLITLRSNDQFNTTVYGFSDRLRGLEGDRNIVLISPQELDAAGLVEGQRVALETALDSDPTRRVAGLRITAYDLPAGCVGAYYPEVNALVPLDYHDEESMTPAYKGAPVRIVTNGQPGVTQAREDWADNAQSTPSRDR